VGIGENGPGKAKLDTMSVPGNSLGLNLVQPKTKEANMKTTNPLEIADVRECRELCDEHARRALDGSPRFTWEPIGDSASTVNEVDVPGGHCVMRAEHEGDVALWKLDAREWAIVADCAGPVIITQKTKAPTKPSKPTTHSLRVGDILHSAWGYEQTQCDFLQIVEVLPGSVRVRKIHGREVDGSAGMMSCRMVPVPNSFCKQGFPWTDDANTPKLYRVRGNSINYKGRYYASKVNPGQSYYCSWYA
jgi:hypothetical protein